MLTFYALSDVQTHVQHVDTNRRRKLIRASGQVTNGAPHTNAEGFVVIAGEAWAHEKVARRRTHMSAQRLRRFAAEGKVRTHPGIGGQGKRLTLYAVADIERIVREEAAARSAPRT